MMSFIGEEQDFRVGLSKPLDLPSTIGGVPVWIIVVSFLRRTAIEIHAIALDRAVLTPGIWLLKYRGGRLVEADVFSNCNFLC